MNIPQEALPWIGVHRTHIDSGNMMDAYKASLDDLNEAWAVKWF